MAPQCHKGPTGDPGLGPASAPLACVTAVTVSALCSDNGYRFRTQLPFLRVGASVELLPVDGEEETSPVTGRVNAVRMCTDPDALIPVIDVDVAA